MTYLDGWRPAMTVHRLDSPLTAAQISDGGQELASGAHRLDGPAFCAAAPGGWQYGDAAVVTSRDGHRFGGTVTGECAVTDGLWVRLSPWVRLGPGIPR
jgi:hypothetical protein